MDAFAELTTYVKRYRLNNLEHGAHFVAPDELLELTAQAGALLGRLPNVIYLYYYHIIVIGDLHGTYEALLQILPGRLDLDAVYVFLGDYVDRGFFGVEILFVLLNLYIYYPNNIVLLRGNHECRIISNYYGFFFEIFVKYCDIYYNNAEVVLQIYEAFIRLFQKLPLAACSRDFVFVHAGVPANYYNIYYLLDIDRKREPESKDFAAGAGGGVCGSAGGFNGVDGPTGVTGGYNCPDGAAGGSAGVTMGSRPAGDCSDCGGCGSCGGSAWANCRSSAPLNPFAGSDPLSDVLWGDFDAFYSYNFVFNAARGVGAVFSDAARAHFTGGRTLVRSHSAVDGVERRAGVVTVFSVPRYDGPNRGAFLDIWAGGDGGRNVTGSGAVGTRRGSAGAGGRDANDGGGNGSVSGFSWGVEGGASGGINNSTSGSTNNNANGSANPKITARTFTTPRHAWIDSQPLFQSFSIRNNRQAVFGVLAGYHEVEICPCFQHVITKDGERMQIGKFQLIIIIDMIMELYEARGESPLQLLSMVENVEECIKIAGKTFLQHGYRFPRVYTQRLTREEIYGILQQLK